MRLGISTYTYTWAIGVPGYLPAAPMRGSDLLRQAEELEVTVVQIADNLPLDRMSIEELAGLRNEADALGIQIEVGTRGIAPGHIMGYLEYARMFQSPILRLVIDTVDHHPSEEEVVATLKPLIPELERSGVQLAIENHDRFKARTFLQIVERLESGRAGICLDTVNSLGALEGPDHVLEVLGPHVVNLHVKDFAIFRASHAMGFTVEGRPAGAGMLDVPRVLQRLSELGRDPNAILELWTVPERDIRDTIAKEKAWAGASIRYLRSLIPPS